MKYQHVILGGTGHIGMALVNNLIGQKQSVMIIGHNPEKAAEWKAKGVGYEAADARYSKQLHEFFSQGERLFILNPPAPPATDTVKEETKSVQAILAALKALHLQKIVVASTYGAQKGDDIADLGTLYELEQGLTALQTPVAVIRSAYYMSNWATVAEAVKKDGILPTLYPADFKLPMVAPEDIGAFAAQLMLNKITGLHFIEGPQLYSPADVAAAFSAELHKPVKVATPPEEKWFDSLQQTGFSPEAAQYMVKMTKLILKQKFEAADPQRGATTLQQYITSLISAG